MQIIKSSIHGSAVALVAASLLVLGACNIQDTFLEPQNPGLIDPSAVSNPSAAAALTALARPEDRMRALRAGFQTHVAKPVAPSELIAVVRSLASLRGWDGFRNKKSEAP